MAKQFYGVVKADFENSVAPDAVWVTLKRRRSVDFPESYVVIGATGDGGDYVIDVSQKNSVGDSPVLEWWFGYPPSSKVVAEDFGAFLWNCVKSHAAASD